MSELKTLTLNGNTYDSFVDQQARDDISEKIGDEELQTAVNTALAQAKESGAFDGDDGVSPSVSVTDITGGHRVTITDASGSHSFDVMDGQGGSTGTIPTIDTVVHGFVVTADPNRIEVTEAGYQNLVSIAEQGTARLRFLVNYGTEEDPYPVEFTQIAHTLKYGDGEAYGYNWFITTYGNEIVRMALYPASGKYYLEGRLTLLARQQ